VDFDESRLIRCRVTAGVGLAKSTAGVGPDPLPAWVTAWVSLAGSFMLRGFFFVWVFLILIWCG
jgi:hypothetical protein